MVRPWLVGIALFAALGAGTPGARAAQSETLSFGATSVVSRVVFNFGSANPWIDGYTPPQSGFVTSPGLNNGTGVQALLDANPGASATFTYDATGLGLFSNNGVVFNYLGGGSLSINLPGGTGGGAPLTFSNTGAGFHVTSLADGARREATGDLVLLPGAVDLAVLGMAGAHQGSGLTRNNGSGTVSKVDLLADPFFVTTYRGAAPLPAIPSLIVTLAQPTVLTLNAPTITLFDATGTALAGSTPPARLPTTAFADHVLSLPFEGAMQLTLVAGDYASAADYSAAVAWLAGSGLQRVTLSQTAVWASPVPEPPAVALLLAGVALLAMRRRAARRT
jgi:hypothetical protein